MVKKNKKNKKRIVFGDKEKELIKAIGLGIVVAGAMVLPGLPQILKPFLKKKGPKEFKRILNNLEEKGVIYLGGDKIVLTEKGNQLMKTIESEELVIEKPEKWDGIWRLVSYDIPEDFKKERDWFRGLLVKLGFVQVQKSLWLFPYDCKEEIAVMAQNLRVSHFVIYMQTDHIPRQTKFLKRFGLI